MSLNQNAVRLLSGKALRLLLARTHTGAGLLVRHNSDRSVHARVIGALAGDLVAHFSPTPGRVLVQQLFLPFASCVQDLLVVEQRRNQAQHQVTSRLATALQVGQAENRLHGVGKD